jgi:glyoxylase-like metal-dependent hydrolase (beta-lactamase superfamily II)
VREIDVRHLGRERVICCFALDGVIVDPGPESSHRTLLEALGNEVPRAILLTHIHLDHAGATGALVRRWPHAEVWVHERGARHVVDPSKLVASATRLYGDDMARLWGEIVPVPQENLRVLAGGERVAGFHVAYTPGHASHHVSYLHEATGTAFVGDVGGVRIDGGPIVPPTPPPDIDLEAWRASLDLVAGWRPCARASCAGATWRARPTRRATASTSPPTCASTAPTSASPRPTCRRCHRRPCGRALIATGSSGPPGSLSGVSGDVHRLRARPRRARRRPRPLVCQRHTTRSASLPDTTMTHSRPAERHPTHH